MVPLRRVTVESINGVYNKLRGKMRPIGAAKKYLGDKSITADGQSDDRPVARTSLALSRHIFARMAIDSAVPPPIDIDAWTISALQSLSVSPTALGTGTPLAIPIDDATPSSKPARATFKPSAQGTVRRPPPLQRDSMKRREALLRGNQGSRQRRRWENGKKSSASSKEMAFKLTMTDHLVGVPNLQPPLPTDWQVRPTHKVQRVPYSIAHFWDRLEEEAETQGRQQRKMPPRQLREAAKRAPLVRDWLRALEEAVREHLLSENSEVVFAFGHGEGAAFK